MNSVTGGGGVKKNSTKKENKLYFHTVELVVIKIKRIKFVFPIFPLFCPMPPLTPLNGPLCTVGHQGGYRPKN